MFEVSRGLGSFESGPQTSVTLRRPRTRYQSSNRSSLRVRLFGSWAKSSRLTSSHFSFIFSDYNDDVVLASNESTTHTLILDARPNSYPSGHIPFSLPLPFSSIATAKPGGYNFLERPETIRAQVVEVVGVGKAEEIFAGRHKVINSTPPFCFKIA